MTLIRYCAGTLLRGIVSSSIDNKKNLLRYFPVAFVTLLFSAPLHAQPWSGILAPDRATDWRNAGIPGGIPERTTVCANIAAGATRTTIQSAINNCPAGQVVSFGAGTFNISGGDLYANRAVTLRGQGPRSTTLVLSGNILLGVGDGFLGGTPSSPAVTSWTGGLSRGSTVLTVGSTANLVAGQIVIIDERNPAWVLPNSGEEGNCVPSNSCGRQESPPNFYEGSTRAAPQWVKIASVDSPTQITIEQPGVAYTHSASLAPEVFYWGNSGTRGNPRSIGIEDMHVDANNNDFAIALVHCDYCWVKNVWINNLARAAVHLRYSFGSIVRDNYMDSDLGGAPTQYGIEIVMSGNALIENNICYRVTACILPETSFGIVFGYNYALNSVSGNLFASFTGHLSHNSFQLLEGNVVDVIAYDNSWGSGSHNTIFRNRSNGVGQNKTSFRRAITLARAQRYNNVVANVLGTTGHHTRYRCDNVDTSSNDVYIYELGFHEECGNTLSNYDTVVSSSLMRWGNWDADTYAENGNTNGIRYCTGSGTGNAACTASETGSTDPTFPGLANPATSFPASFYLNSKPAWFGDVSWPPIGPDVSCTSNCVSNAGGRAAKIPAQLCYENTAKDSSGFLTAYDARACYVSGPVPRPPSAVSVQ